MIAEFAHFYLFGFICVTSGNHLTQAGQIRGRGSAPAAALLLPPSHSQFGPSAPPGPLLCSETEARLLACGRPDRVCPESCRRPWGLPGAGSGCGEMRGAGSGPGPRAPVAGCSRGSTDVPTAGAEPWRRGGGGQGPPPPAGGGCARRSVRLPAGTAHPGASPPPSPRPGLTPRSRHRGGPRR